MTDTLIAYLPRYLPVEVDSLNWVLKFNWVVTARKPISCPYSGELLLLPREEDGRSSARLLPKPLLMA